jgi:hypothetical protein
LEKYIGVECLIKQYDVNAEAEACLINLEPDLNPKLDQKPDLNSKSNQEPTSSTQVESSKHENLKTSLKSEFQSNLKSETRPT